MKSTLILCLIFISSISSAESFQYELDSLDSRSFYIALEGAPSKQERINDILYWDTRILKSTNNAFSIKCKAKRHIGTKSPLAVNCISDFDFELSSQNETLVFYGDIEDSIVAQFLEIKDIANIKSLLQPKTEIATEEKVKVQLKNGAIYYYPSFHIRCREKAISGKIDCYAMLIPRKI